MIIGIILMCVQIVLIKGEISVKKVLQSILVVAVVTVVTFSSQNFSNSADPGTVGYNNVNTEEKKLEEQNVTPSAHYDPGTVGY